MSDSLGPAWPGRRSSGPGRAFAFFGRLVVVTSDDADVLDALEAVYGRQRAALPPPGGTADLAVHVASGADGSKAGARIEVAGRTVRVPRRDQLVHYAHLVVMNAAASLVSDGVVLHTGAVARAGRAVLLVGHSGRGKTTLTLELVRRGWGFLSDDFAAVGTDGTVHPFPRRVNLTDASLGLLGLTPPPGAPRLATFGGIGKWMVDVEDLFPGAVAGPRPLAAVVLLDEPPAFAPGRAAAPAGVWRLQLDHLPPGFAAALAALPGVTEVAPMPVDEALVLDVRTTPGTHVVAAVDDLCLRFDVAVLGAWNLAASAATGRQADAVRDLANRPGAGGAAAGRPTSAAGGGPTSAAAGGTLGEAVPPELVLPELMRHALSLSGARFLGATGDAEVRHTVACLRAALARGVTAVRLAPGALDRMADSVEAVVGPPR